MHYVQLRKRKIRKNKGKKRPKGLICSIYITKTYSNITKVTDKQSSSEYDIPILRSGRGNNFLDF